MSKCMKFCTGTGI